MTRCALNKGVAHLGNNPDRVFLVGDTVNDIRCGQGIGATTIGVCTCSTPRADLEKARADYVLNDLSEIGRTNLI
jgi:phosphoglycolate phosphatase-like HAD superfamily hydrolase